MLHSNGNQKKARVATLTIDKIDFKTDSNKRWRMVLHNDKGVNQQERTTL